MTEKTPPSPPASPEEEAHKKEQHVSKDAGSRLDDADKFATKLKYETKTGKDLKEAQEQYEHLSEKMERLNDKRDTIVQRLTDEGLLEHVKDSRSAWLLTTSYHVDYDRVLEGTEPATYYSNGYLNEMVTSTSKEPERFTHSEETLSVGGEEYPKTINAIWDGVYDHKRTIDLHILENGQAAYRSYRHPWDLADLVHGFDTVFRRIDMECLLAEERESGGEEQFDTEHDVLMIEGTTEDLADSAAERWQLEVEHLNASLDEWRREYPPELKDTTICVLLSGLKVVATNEGSPLLIIDVETAPLFRKYFDELFNLRVEPPRLRKYNDGCYATDLIVFDPDAPRWEKEYHKADTEVQPLVLADTWARFGKAITGNKPSATSLSSTRSTDPNSANKRQHCWLTQRDLQGPNH